MTRQQDRRLTAKRDTRPEPAFHDHMRRWGRLLGAALLAGCVGSSTPVATPQAISAKYRAQLEENQRATTQSIIWPICDDPATPRAATCGLLSTWERYEAFVRKTCKEDPDAELTERCTALWNDAYETAFRRRYPRATDDDVTRRCKKVDCDELEIYELALLASHNAAVARLGTERGEEIIAEHRRAQESAAAQRRAQEADAEQWRRAAAIIAAGLQGAAEGARIANGQATTYTPQAPTLRGPSVRTATCSSDYECGMGAACVKPAYSSTGTCVRTVDANGSPTFQGPRGDSVGPAGGGCMGGGTCPAGYRCEFGGRFAGQCVK